MSRTSSVVVCKEGVEDHILSDNFPNTGQWIYCCNCQTFISWDSDRHYMSIMECPFCLSSLNPRMYACDHCAVTMLDFDDQTLRKHHTVLSWGMPQPACPGCHQFPQSTPKAHFCDVLQCKLATARSHCPYCLVELSALQDQREVHSDDRRVFALAEAEARALQAEERILLAEESARKELELRVAAEQKAVEMERKVTQELTNQQLPNTEAIAARDQAEKAIARAELEAMARAEAEAKAQEAEVRRTDALRAAQKEAELRAAAEVKAQEIAGIYTSRLYQIQEETKKHYKKDMVSIALYAAIATFLLLALIMLIITMLRLYST